MKTTLKFICIQTIFLLFSLITYSQAIKVDCNGNVGIGGNPTSERLHIQGDTRFYAWMTDILYDQDAGYYGGAFIPESNNTCNIGTTSKVFHQIIAYDLQEISDSAQKENIKDLENALEIISGLRGIRFDFKKEVYLNEWNNKNPADLERMEHDRKNKIGFIAQEMVHVLPEAVCIDDSTGIYTVNYTRVIPVLVNAMNEQQKLINNLTVEMEALKNAESLKKAAADNIDIETNSINTSYIIQNSPNPFSESTTIEYYLAENVRMANIYIYDMNGKQLRNFDLYQKGKGSVKISGKELYPGMYMYALITDGQVIDIKRMILTD